MSTLYHQLTQEQRYQIWALRNNAYTLSQIGDLIGCHKSTVSRELRRNSHHGIYDAKHAHTLSLQRKRNAAKSTKQCSATDKLIAERIQLGWSPAALSARMKIECSAQENTLSHTATVDKRKRVGDWEGDLIHGQSAYLVTLVERTSRFTLVKRVFSKQKNEVANALISLLNQVSKKLTLTLDNGGEFADHVRVSEDTGTHIFFARPYASWQRGTNENTNGRIRRFWPKKLDIGLLSNEQIATKIGLLNFTPRPVLGGLTPVEVFTGKRVALIT